MGEVKAVSKLAPELAKALKAPLLFTSSTASGRAEASKLGEARLAPLDFYPCAASFIARHRPLMLVVAETEIWPATLYAAARAGVPVFMVNARISEKTFSLYRALWPLTRLAFSGVKQVLAQTAADAGRFRLLAGLEGLVTETGNLKHDLLGVSASGQEKAAEFVKAAGWDNSPVFTAGSTHPAEDPIIVQAWLEARKSTPALKLVLVPRHPERLAETEAVLAKAGAGFMKWSSGPRPGTDCLVVDAMGLLQAFYAVSDVCFVGGTLDDTGGHNLLEPALFSKPALFGPDYRNARHAGDALIKGKGGFLAETAPEMAAKLSELLTEPGAMEAARTSASKTLAGLRGATAKSISAITAHFTQN
jgi:3-deoxy-D-manno-octulosonic-acid transferase